MFLLFFLFSFSLNCFAENDEEKKSALIRLGQEYKNDLEASLQEKQKREAAYKNAKDHFVKMIVKIFGPEEAAGFELLDNGFNKEYSDALDKLLNYLKQVNSGKEIDNNDMDTIKKAAETLYIMYEKTGTLSLKKLELIKQLSSVEYKEQVNRLKKDLRRADVQIKQLEEQIRMEEENMNDMFNLYYYTHLGVNGISILDDNNESLIDKEVKEQAKLLKEMRYSTLSNLAVQSSLNIFRNQIGNRDPQSLSEEENRRISRVNDERISMFTIQRNMVIDYAKKTEAAKAEYTKKAVTFEKMREQLKVRCGVDI